VKVLKSKKEVVFEDEVKEFGTKMEHFEGPGERA
jgi:hypothetical protein